MSRTVIGFITLVAVVAALVGGLALVGSPRPSATGRVEVVAAENVYGNIVAQIGGPHVSVTSILHDPNADPHLYTASTRNALAVSRAAVVIQNGVGYDSFIQKLEAAAPSAHRIVVTMAGVLGVRGADANPHLWYDVPRLDRIGGAIAAALERADPGHRQAYGRGLRRFERNLRPLVREVASIRAAHAGDPVAYTEPVPGYLLAAAGLDNLTPVAFARAIEDGSEPSPEAVSQMTVLLTGHRVRVLLYNSQAASPITARIEAAARSAGIPVIGVTETLPPGETFQHWQLRQALALERALDR
jgi:zinc/manganese transport system substrate-binding protein